MTDMVLRCRSNQLHLVEGKDIEHYFPHESTRHMPAYQIVLNATFLHGLGLVFAVKKQ